MMIELTPGNVSLEQLRHWTSTDAQFSLSAESYARIEASAQTVSALCASDASVYGINTGFGKLASEKIDHEQLGQLQENLILSHCCGLGEPLDDEVVRTVLLLKLLSLARGYSGVTRETIDCLLALLNHQIYPVIPAKGSVGASGDLAPLAHMSAAMLGIGEVRHNGKTLAAREALISIGVIPLQLRAKEGLALINGTQVSTALAVQALFKTERLFAAALTVGALSIDAMKGSDAPFDQRIHAVRGHQTQADVAAVIRRQLKGSNIRASHVGCSRVQDPYSLRCQPQVMGAVLSSIQHVANVLLVESNGVTDNPLVFTDEQEALSGGNFHAEPVALVADILAVAIAEIGALSERRLANLVDTNQSGLPAFLVDDAGLNSGFMIAQVTAAALASENKSLAHPASVDSLPTSANQEDHVSMATFAARRLHEMVDNTAGILGIELLAAVQGIEFHEESTSPQLSHYTDKVREQVSRYEQDRYMAVDLVRARALVMSELFVDASMQLLPSYA